MCVVFWDREDYIAEAIKQLNDESVYKSVKFKDKIIQGFSEERNGIFKGPKERGKTTEKELTCVTIEHKKPTNQCGKMYLLPKIHKSLYDVPGRPVTSNCGRSTEKSLAFLDNIFKENMQNVLSYMKDSHGFLKKIKHLKNISDNALLVTPDIVGLRALKEALDRREEINISTEDLVLSKWLSLCLR